VQTATTVTIPDVEDLQFGPNNLDSIFFHNRLHYYYMY
jgi:hypothetical protein